MKGKLTPRKIRFVQEYLIDLNATQAAIRAGYSAKTANREGTRLLSNDVVAEAVAEAQAKRASRVEVDQDFVLRELLEIVRADPRELIQYVRTSCPKCWPDGEREEPNPECGECCGRGKGHVLLADTRKLSRGAAKLYAGVQVGRDGIKVNMRDQDAALRDIGRHLGMFKERHEHTGADGKPIAMSVEVVFVDAPPA